MTTARLPVQPEGPVPDDERVLRHLWNLTAEHVERHGTAPFHVNLSGAMLDRLTGKGA